MDNRCCTRHNNSGLMMVVLVWYCNLGVTPLWLVIAANIIMFIAVTARMISASALMTAMYLHSTLEDKGLNSDSSSFMPFRLKSPDLERESSGGYGIKFSGNGTTS